MLKNKEQEKEVKKGEFDLKESFVLWKQKSKQGTDYLKGVTALDEHENNIGLVVFYNTNKKNPKEPDIRIYSLNDEGNQDKEVCDLWETVSKNKKRYLTGSTDDKEKIIAFYTEEQNKEGTRPYIRAYYKN